jgi:3-phenylpropionate/trans-cinnamate dioxygenase ferredoxin component
MDGFTRVLDADDLAEGAMAGVDVDGHRVLVAHLGDAFYATQGHCPHMGGSLWKGRLEGFVVTCPLHHSRFDLRSGAIIRWTDWTGVVDGVSEAIRHPRPLRTYEVKVEDGGVFVGPEREAPAGS